MLRPILEKITRRTAFRRSLPASVGGAPIYTSGSAGLKYIFEPIDRIDPVLCALAAEFVAPGHVVWDVGANVGLFAFAAAHLAGPAGKVVGIEADMWLVQLLRRSASIQPPSSAPVSIVPAAIAGACGLRTFDIATRSRASNSLAGYGNSQAGGVAERQTVVSVSLDWLSNQLPAPDVLKIDVEGAELEVLQGAQRLLSAKGPVVLCEVCEKSSIEVTRLLRDAGYRIYDAETPGPRRAEIESASWNTVAIRARANRVA